MKKATHEERVKLACEICDAIKEVLGEHLRAFVIFASVAKNEDVAYSDLEMMAITSELYEEHCSEFIRAGIRCEVDFVPMSSAIKQAGRITTRWPVAADQWHNFKSLYVKKDDDCLEQIKASAIQALADDEGFNRAIILKMLILFESVTKLKSAKIRGIEGGLNGDLCYIAATASRLVALVNRHYYKGVRSAMEDSKRLSKLPQEYCRLIEIVHGEVEADIKSRYNSALELWEYIRSWIAGMDIDWINQAKLEFPKKVKK